MATSQIASMLDELMGRNRNVAPNENVRELQWSDPEVCKYDNLPITEGLMLIREP